MKNLQIGLKKHFKKINMKKIKLAHNIAIIWLLLLIVGIFLPKEYDEITTKVLSMLISLIIVIYILPLLDMYENKVKEMQELQDRKDNMEKDQ
jgi:predicted ferric reductase